MTPVYNTSKPVLLRRPPRLLRNERPLRHPGTTILINKAGLQTQEEFEHYERVMTFARLAEPLPDILITYGGYKALHHHIFQDVFEWVGETRTVALAKGQTFFGPPLYVDSEMTKRFQKIAEENHLQHLSPETFASRTTSLVFIPSPPIVHVPSPFLRHPQPFEKIPWGYEDRGKNRALGFPRTLYLGLVRFVALCNGSNPTKGRKGISRHCGGVGGEKGFG